MNTAPHEAARRFFALLAEVEDVALRDQLQTAAVEMIGLWLERAVAVTFDRVEARL